MKTFLLALLILVAPVAAYQDTVFASYGFRDDYSFLREAREEPGKITRLCASQGRPLLGVLLETSYRLAGDVDRLPWLRLASVASLAALGLATFASLRRLGWRGVAPVAAGLLLPLAPPAQVMAGWATTWPFVLPALLALAAFALVDPDGGDRRLPRPGAFALAGLLLVVASLVYPSNTLFYAVPLAAALPQRRHLTVAANLRWAAMHAALVLGSLALAFLLFEATAALLDVPPSPRIAFETDVPGKLVWLLGDPLHNALNPFRLNDAFAPRAWGFREGGHLALAGVGAGVLVELARHGRRAGLTRLAGFLVLLPFSFLVSGVAAERGVFYRTLLPMTGVVWVFGLLALSDLRAVLPRRARLLPAVALAALCAASFPLARGNAFDLIARPQHAELALMERAAAAIDLADRPRVFVIEPALRDSPAGFYYGDEFGSLSSNSPWVPREMFWQALRETHPELPRLDGRLRFASGPLPPPAGSADVTIDMRSLRRDLLVTAAVRPPSDVPGRGP